MANPFSTKLKQAGLMIVGGLLTLTGVYGGSQITTGGVSLPEVNNAGTAESVKVYVADQEFNASLTATGSTTVDYPSACIKNPLTQLPTSAGSGSLTSLSIEFGNNPAAIGADVVFAKDCGTATDSGTTLLIDNTCTATGCVRYLSGMYAATGALWNGADYIKVILKGNPTSAFTGRIRGSYEDIYGE